MNNEGWQSVRDSLPPQNEQLRLWVRLVNGQEVEIHGFLNEDNHWDISLAWKMSVMEVLFWQRIVIPYAPPPVLSAPPPSAAAIRPQLNVWQVYPTLTLGWFYSPKDRYHAWVYQGGRLLGSHFSYTMTLETFQRFMEPEHREAALWLWAAYKEELIPAILPEDWRLSYLSLTQWQSILLATHKVLVFEIGNRLIHAYRELEAIQNEPVILERDIPVLLRIKDLILCFGDATVEQLYQSVAFKVQDFYEKERWEWVQEHGSPWLKFCLRCGYPVETNYALERSALEYPKFNLGHNLPLRPSPYPVPDLLNTMMAPYIYYHGFVWYAGDDPFSWILAKSNYLGRYTLYRRFRYDSNGSGSIE